MLKIYRNTHHYNANKSAGQHNRLENMMPQIIHEWDHVDLFGGPVLLMEYVHGTNLAELYHTYSSDQRTIVHTQMAEILQAVHSIDTTKKMWETHTLYTRVKELFAQVQSKDTLPPNALEKIQIFLEKYQPWKREILQSRTYGDFHMENILVKESGDLVLIDWDTSRVAPIWMENEMLLEQSIIPVGIVSEALEEYYPHKLAIQTLYDISKTYPQLFPKEFISEIQLLALLRILYKYNVGDDVQDKPRAYGMGFAVYEEVFEKELIKRLAN